MATYLVTGGTGLIGSNICRLLVEAGDHVRAMVRPGSDYQPLAGFGVEPREGDITSPDDIVRSAAGCDAIINSAAVLGGAEQQTRGTARDQRGWSFACVRRRGEA